MGFIAFVVICWDKIESQLFKFNVKKCLLFNLIDSPKTILSNIKINNIFKLFWKKSNILLNILYNIIIALIKKLCDTNFEICDYSGTLC